MLFYIFYNVLWVTVNPFIKFFFKFNNAYIYTHTYVLCVTLKMIVNFKNEESKFFAIILITVCNVLFLFKNLARLGIRNKSNTINPYRFISSLMTHSILPMSEVTKYCLILYVNSQFINNSLWLI